VDYREIRFAVEEGVATLTLHRPERRNAYTPRMGDELVHAFARARDDAAVRAVILTGAGRGFCAGVDLEVLKAQASSGGGPRLGEEDFIRRWPLEMLEYPKPVIAALNGAAIGVGVTMTLPCDVRIASEEAKLGLTFAKLGLLPGLGSTHLLPRIVGLANALDLVLSARVVSAAEAAAMGLVSRAVPADALLPEARALASAMAECRPEVLAAAKRAVRYGAAHAMEEAMANEAAESAALRRERSG